ncbi:interleukin-6 receptor subunit beta-like [Ictalurus furcatus]|uniref:interleukin-6 receptor subunit beta-like n=1 Tax=Ictalurus furcatus TaxID=66913 RepID=UPI00235078B2|nr:interleukin-6 receptor subunit beta-like [Ictalurus furcatus]
MNSVIVCHLHDTSIVCMCVFCSLTGGSSVEEGDTKKEDVLNIFSVASGHLYECFLRLKRRFWPQVPNPSHRTIANWSPDCPNKPDTPKERILAEVSVVEVDMDDGKSLCDEDKAVMPLKKYFSEERSSGIGGSSGMSTPHQSVSSNDEADSGQTTVSTVQYSATVSSGYKGQTPGTQASVFSRSELTQPLLECEENPEHLSEASGHQTNSYFKRHRGNEQLHMYEGEEPSFSSLSFSPIEEEDSPTLTEDPPGPAFGYMP